MTCSPQWAHICVLHTSLSFDIELDVVIGIEVTVK